MKKFKLKNFAIALSLTATTCAFAATNHTFAMDNNPKKESSSELKKHLDDKPESKSESETIKFRLKLKGDCSLYFAKNKNSREYICTLFDPNGNPLGTFQNKDKAMEALEQYLKQKKKADERPKSDISKYREDLKGGFYLYVVVDNNEKTYTLFDPNGNPLGIYSDKKEATKAHEQYLEKKEEADKKAKSEQNIITTVAAGKTDEKIINKDKNFPSGYSRIQIENKNGTVTYDLFDPKGESLGTYSNEIRTNKLQEKNKQTSEIEEQSYIPESKIVTSIYNEQADNDKLEKECIINTEFPSGFSFTQTENNGEKTINSISPNLDEKSVESFSSLIESKKIHENYNNENYNKKLENNLELKKPNNKNKQTSEIEEQSYIPESNIVTSIYNEKADNDKLEKECIINTEFPSGFSFTQTENNDRKTINSISPSLDEKSVESFSSLIESKKIHENYNNENYNKKLENDLELKKTNIEIQKKLDEKLKTSKIKEKKDEPRPEIITSANTGKIYKKTNNKNVETSEMKENKHKAVTHNFFAPKNKFSGIYSNVEKKSRQDRERKRNKYEHQKEEAKKLQEKNKQTLKIEEQEDEKEKNIITAAAKKTDIKDIETSKIITSVENEKTDKIYEKLQKLMKDKEEQTDVWGTKTIKFTLPDGCRCMVVKYGNKTLTCALMNPTNKTAEKFSSLDELYEKRADYFKKLEQNLEDNLKSPKKPDKKADSKKLKTSEIKEQEEKSKTKTYPLDFGYYYTKNKNKIKNCTLFNSKKVPLKDYPTEEELLQAFEPIKKRHNEMKNRRGKTELNPALQQLGAKILSTRKNNSGSTITKYLLPYGFTASYVESKDRKISDLNLLDPNNQPLTEKGERLNMQTLEQRYMYHRDKYVEEQIKEKEGEIQNLEEELQKSNEQNKQEKLEKLKFKAAVDFVKFKINQIIQITKEPVKDKTDLLGKIFHLIGFITYGNLHIFDHDSYCIKSTDYKKMIEKLKIIEKTDKNALTNLLEECNKRYKNLFNQNKTKV